MILVSSQSFFGEKTPTKKIQVVFRKNSTCQPKKHSLNRGVNPPHTLDTGGRGAGKMEMHILSPRRFPRFDRDMQQSAWLENPYHTIPGPSVVWGAK